MNTYFYATGDISVSDDNSGVFAGWVNYPTYAVNELFSKQWTGTKDNLLRSLHDTAGAGDSLDIYVSRLAVFIRDSVAGAVRFDTESAFTLDMALCALSLVDYHQLAREWLNPVSSVKGSGA